MKPADVFAVVVRTVGLLACLGACAILFLAFLAGPPNPPNAFELAILDLALLGIGLWLLRGAPSLIAFAFPTSRERDRDRFFRQLVTELRREAWIRSQKQSDDR
jgi:hypothetical protein